MKILNNIVTILILVGVAYMGLMLHCARGENAELREELAELHGDVAIINGEITRIPQLAKAVIGYEGDFLTIAERLDSLNIESTTVYLPPEGSSEIIFMQDTIAMAQIIENFQLLSELMQLSPDDTLAIQQVQAKLDSLYYQLFQVESNIVDHGFTFSPAVGGGIDDEGEAKVNLGARLYFDNHWGAGANLGLDFPEPTDEEEFLEDVSLNLFVGYRGIFGLRNVSGDAFGGHSLLHDDDWEFGGQLNFYFDD